MGTISFPPINTSSYSIVNTYAELPNAEQQSNKIFIVKTSTGSAFLFNKRNAGLYYSNGVVWSFMGNTAMIDDSASSTEKVYSSAKILTLLSNSGGSVYAQQVTELEGKFKVAYATMYVEYTYSSGKIISIDIWDTASKGTKLFTKGITYSGDAVVSTDISDNVSGLRLVTTFGYSSGILVSKTKTITQG